MTSRACGFHGISLALAIRYREGHRLGLHDLFGISAMRRDQDQIATIEQRLGVVLPDAYRRALLKGVTIAGFDPEPYFLQDPKEILITNIELRMMPGGNSFAGAPWPEDRICIGFDRCGTYYAIAAGDPQCAVEIFNHETDAFEPHSDDLPSYFAHLSELLDRIAALRGNRPHEDATPTDAPLSPDAVLTRANSIRESVLEPISMTEWAAFVELDPDLEMRGYRIGRNPFTHEEFRCDWPGLAVMKGDGTGAVEFLPVMKSDPAVQEFVYAYGRVTALRPGTAALEKLDLAAKALNAKVITGW